MNNFRNAICVFACVGFANGACACIFLPDESSASDKRGESLPVSQDRQCRTINIGVDDDEFLGLAQDLGAGRVMQVLNDRNSSVYLADCNTREITIVSAPYSIVPELETSCGPHLEFADLTGPEAILSLSGGEDLEALVDIVVGLGGRETDPIARFFRFGARSNDGTTEIFDVGSKDRFDLLCGCKTLYPRSAGARN